MNNSISGHIMAFGMSGYLVTEDIKKAENRYKVALGHTVNSPSADDAQYSSQFEQSVRTEASEMSEHYKLFYCLESSIRRLITDILMDAEGAAWWDSERVPDGVKQEVESRIQKEVDGNMTRRSESKIDYTTFGELSEIIKSNWGVFETVFSSKRAVEKVMSSLNLLRGPIAHCCPLADDEVDRLRLTVKDWFRTMA